LHLPAVDIIIYLFGFVKKKMKNKVKFWEAHLASQNACRLIGGGILK